MTLKQKALDRDDTRKFFAFKGTLAIRWRQTFLHSLVPINSGSVYCPRPKDFSQVEWSSKAPHEGDAKRSANPTQASLPRLILGLEKNAEA